MEDHPKNDGEMLEMLRDTALETAVQQLRLLHGLKKNVSGATWPSAGPACQPTTGTSAAPAAVGAFSSPESGAPATGASDFLFDLARLSLNNYRGWLRVSANHFDFLADALSRLSGRPVEKPATAHPCLELRHVAKVGDKSHVPFVLENPEPRETEVSFTPLALQTADHLALPQPALVARVAADGSVLAGVRIVLWGRESARLCLVVDLAGGAPGSYRGESLVVMGGRIVGQLRLALDVVPA